MESLENQPQVFHPSHRPWKSLKRFPHSHSFDDDSYIKERPKPPPLRIVMKPKRNHRYLAWIRTQPCCVCGSTKFIEASHTGPHGIGQKSPDTSAIPLCAKHHRTGNDSYHRLGPRKFSKAHNLDIPAIVRRLNLKPTIRVEARMVREYFDEGR